MPTFKWTILELYCDNILCRESIRIEGNEHTFLDKIRESGWTIVGKNCYCKGHSRSSDTLTQRRSE